MLKNVIERLAEDTGMNLTVDRAALVKLANRGAEDLHTKIEANFLRREITVVVPRNKVIALPLSVGNIRGLAESTNDLRIPLHTRQQPRYVKSNREYTIHNWRDLGFSPIHTSLDVIAPLKLQIAVVENPAVVVKILGQTVSAQKIEEEVTVSAVEVSTVNSFGPAIFSIASFNTGRLHDIIILDDDDNEIAVLANNAQNTQYKLIDVSEYYWNIDTENDETLVDVLYKLPYTSLENDSDNFLFSDSAVYFNAMALWLATQQGKEIQAGGFQAQALIEAEANKNDQELMQEKKLDFGRTPYYGTIRRQHGFPNLKYGRI
jgi:hypothetical protein